MRPISLFLYLCSMAQHNDIGAWGEELARNYMITQGWTVMEQNKKLGHNELDIIAVKGDRIAFVEVKTRSSRLTDPLDAIDARKIKRLFRAADAFMRSHNIRHEPQMDIIVIVGTPESGYQLDHYPDALRPPLAGAY